MSTRIGAVLGKVLLAAIPASAVQTALSGQDEVGEGIMVDIGIAGSDFNPGDRLLYMKTMCGPDGLRRVVGWKFFDAGRELIFIPYEALLGRREPIENTFKTAQA